MYIEKILGFYTKAVKKKPIWYRSFCPSVKAIYFKYRLPMPNFKNEKNLKIFLSTRQKGHSIGGGILNWLLGQVG